MQSLAVWKVLGHILDNYAWFSNAAELRRNSDLFHSSFQLGQFRLISREMLSPAPLQCRMCVCGGVRVLLSQFLRVFFLLFKSVRSGSIFSKHLDKTWRINVFLANPEGMLCCSVPSFMKPGNCLAITQVRWSASPKAVKLSPAQAVCPGGCKHPSEVTAWTENVAGTGRCLLSTAVTDSWLCRVLQERQTSSESEVLGRKMAKTQLVLKHLEI